MIAIRIGRPLAAQGLADHRGETAPRVRPSRIRWGPPGGRCRRRVPVAGSAGSSVRPSSRRPARDLPRGVSPVLVATLRQDRQVRQPQGTLSRWSHERVIPGTGWVGGSTPGSGRKSGGGGEKGTNRSSATVVAARPLRFKLLSPACGQCLPRDPGLTGWRSRAYRNQVEFVDGCCRPASDGQGHGPQVLCSLCSGALGRIASFSWAHGDSQAMSRHHPNFSGAPE